MHSPGRPEDLPAPEILWSRAALFALLELAPSRGTKDASVELDRRGLCYVGPAPYRSWRIAVAPGDEALLCGLADEDENTRKPDRSGFEILDLLAGLPERWNSPELRTEVDGRHYSFVYWHTSGEWHRSPYPEHIWDDGLAACFGDWLHLSGTPRYSSTKMTTRCSFNSSPTPSRAGSTLTRSPARSVGCGPSPRIPTLRLQRASRLEQGCCKGLSHLITGRIPTPPHSAPDCRARGDDPPIRACAGLRWRGVWYLGTYAALAYQRLADKYLNSYERPWVGVEGVD